MTVKVNDLDLLHLYINGVINRANCHAQNVDVVALLLVGCIIWRAKPGSFEVRQASGGMGNMLWFTSKTTGRRYCVAYNHNTEQIELRDRNMTGQALHVFCNATLATVIKQTFAVI